MATLATLLLPATAFSPALLAYAPVPVAPLATTRPTRRVTLAREPRILVFQLSVALMPPPELAPERPLSMQQHTSLMLYLRKKRNPSTSIPCRHPVANYLFRSSVRSTLPRFPSVVGK